MTIFEAIKKNNIGEVKKIINKNKDILTSIDDKESMTPLFYAIYYNKTDITKYLADSGADMYSEFGPFTYALEVAMYAKKTIKEFDKEIIDFLFKYVKEESTKYYLLIIAIISGDHEIIKKLITCKIDFEYTTEIKIGNTNNLLLISAEHNNLFAIKKLIENNYNYNKNNRLNNAVNMAKQKKYMDIAEFLQKYQNNKNDNDLASDNVNNLFISINEGEFDIVKQLLKKDKSLLNCKNGKEQTPLVYAISNHKYKIAEYLIEEGADVNIKYGRIYPLTIVINTCDDKKLIEIIIKKQKDINYRQGKFLFDAINFGRVDVVKMLINKGVDIKLKNLFGQDALTAVNNELKKIKGNEREEDRAKELEKIKALLIDI